jgi:hypothetical protein
MADSRTIDTAQSIGEFRRPIDEFPRITAHVASIRSLVATHGRSQKEASAPPRPRKLTVGLPFGSW